MKLTKIIVSALLVAAVALSMAACGGDSVTTTTVAGATTAGPKTTTKANVTTVAATTTAAGGTTTAKAEWPKDVEPVWGGFWDVDENGVYTSYNRPEGNDFSILPVGQIEEGKTKYTVSVKYIWAVGKEKGILFCGKDVDGDGELREDFDYYQMILSNNYMAYCTNPGKWGNVWETKDVSGAGLTAGDEVKLTVILDTAANTVEGYLNDTFIGTWDINLEGYGIYFGIATKVVEAQFWDVTFKAE